MKCDELKAETIVPQGCTITLQMYPKAEADAAIAELKDKCQMHDFFWEGCGFAKRGFKNTIAVSEAFDRLEAENAELKQKLEDAKASHYAEMLDAGMENRRLKRALWLAREWRAWCEEQFWFVINGDEPRDVYHLIVTKRIHRTPTEWIDYWQKVEQKCKAKAEEYR